MKLEPTENFEEEIDVCGFDEGSDILVMDNAALTNIKQEVVDCASSECHEIPQDPMHVPPTYVPMLPPWMPPFFCLPDMLKHSAMVKSPLSPPILSPPPFFCFPDMMMSPISPPILSPHTTANYPFFCFPDMVKSPVSPPISPPATGSPHIHGYSSENELAAHINASLSDKHQLFECDLCDTEFYDRTTLTIHKRHVHGGKRFQCNHCGKNFTKKWNLRVHINIHTGDTPFPCSICSKGFSNPNAMRKHRQKCKPQKKQTKL